MFCAYRVHRIRKNIFVISKNHRNSWENSYTKTQQLRVTNSFSKINAWMPYIQAMTALVTCGRHMLNGFQGPDPIFTRCPFRFLSFCPGFSLAGMTLSLERRPEEMIKWWVDHKHQYHIYVCVHSELFRYIAMVITSFKMATEATYLLCSIGVLWPIWPMVTTSKSPAASKLRVNH